MTTDDSEIQRIIRKKHRKKTLHKKKFKKAENSRKKMDKFLDTYEIPK